MAFGALQSQQPTDHGRELIANIVIRSVAQVLFEMADAN